MRRGAICWVNLEDACPPEFGKTRPAIIVSNSEHNFILDTVVVVPLSTAAPEVWPLRLKLQAPGHKTSYAVLPGVRQVSKARLINVIGGAPREFMGRLDDALAAYLSD